MLESPLMLRGHQFNEAGVVPVRARRDGPKRTANKGKMAGVAETPSQTTCGVPNAGEAAHHHRRQWTSGAPRMVWSRPSAELIRWIFFQIVMPARACQVITQLFHTLLGTNGFILILMLSAAPSMLC